MSYCQHKSSKHGTTSKGEKFGVEIDRGGGDSLEYAGNCIRRMFAD